MNSFQNTGEIFLKSCRSSKSTRSHGRKRRANSDSELTFMDTQDGKTFFSQQLFTMHNDDIDIDIMADTHSDSNVLNGSSAIDPSQMFIMLTNAQNTFSYSPPHTVLNTSNVDTHVTHTCDGQQIVTSTVLDHTPHDQSLFTAQLYLVDTSIPGATACISEGNGTHLAEEQVNGIYGIHTTASSSMSNAGFGHIPAKFLKRKLPSQLIRKAVASQVDTNDGRDEVNQRWVTHKEEKQDLQKTGCTWKNGIWSNDEEELLRNNIDDYCKANNIPDPTIMIFSTPREERKAFYRSISVGLNRPLFAVYRKVLRMYDQKNYVGKYSPDELEKLEKLCRLYKNDWVLIGSVLGRSAASVKDRARLLNCPNKRGKWGTTELEMLSSLVHEMTNTSKGDSVTTGINWTEISDRMKTRTSKQCRTKWLHFLNWKESGGKEWTKTDEKELVQRILSAAVTEESKIDWDGICSGWTSVRSPQWLRQKWWNIKKNVPDFQVCNFEELMGFLKTTYIDEQLPEENDKTTDDVLLPQQFVVGQTDDVIESNEPVVTDRGDFTSLQVTLPEALMNQNLDSGVTNQFAIPTLSLHIQLPSDLGTISSGVQLHSGQTSTEDVNFSNTTSTHAPATAVHMLYPT